MKEKNLNSQEVKVNQNLEFLNKYFILNIGLRKRQMFVSSQNVKIVKMNNSGAFKKKLFNHKIDIHTNISLFSVIFFLRSKELK